MQALRTVDESVSNVIQYTLISTYPMRRRATATLTSRRKNPKSLLYYSRRSLPDRHQKSGRSFEFHATQQEITSLSYSDSVDRLSHILKITAQHDVLLLPVVGQ